MKTNAHHKLFSTLAGAVTSAVIGLALIVSTIAHLSQSGTVAERAPVIRPAATPTLAQHPSQISALMAVQLSQNALRDMHARAVTSLHGYVEVPGSFGATSEWSAGWYLQWLDVEQDGVTVRIYHATDVRWPERRFVATWNDDGTAEWQKVN